MHQRSRARARLAAGGPVAGRRRRVRRRGWWVRQCVMVVVGTAGSILWLLWDPLMNKEPPPGVVGMVQNDEVTSSVGAVSKGGGGGGGKKGGGGGEKEEETREEGGTVGPREAIVMLEGLLAGIRSRFQSLSRASAGEVWSGFVEEMEEHVVNSRLETAVLKRVRSDGSVFASVASYRDASLNDTLTSLFDRASNPDGVSVGIVQQICRFHCKTGVQVVSAPGEPVRTRVSDAPADRDGVAEYCAIFPQRCRRQIRVLYVNETEALGPAFARYLASKLWDGETYFMQLDAHVDMADQWDSKIARDLQSLPGKPVISAYPPGLGPDRAWQHRASSKLCHSEFSSSPVEYSILRISNTAPSQQQKPDDYAARRIPFVAAGFFAVHSEFLHAAPFDPFLAFVFMGEEIHLSARLFTNGYDAYAPRTNLLAHAYRPGRLGLPKFWETTARTFNGRTGFNNQLSALIIQRVKFVVGYPDNDVQSSVDVLQHLHYPRNYGLGHLRSLSDFLDLAGIDFNTHSTKPNHWCVNGLPPPLLSSESS